MPMELQSLVHSVPSRAPGQRGTGEAFLGCEIISRYQRKADIIGYTVYTYNIYIYILFLDLYIYIYI